MQPSQSTPLIEAAYHLKNIKDQQRHAMDVAMTLVDRLPFTGLSFNITSLLHNHRFEWGVQVNAHTADAALFPALAAELGAKQVTDIHTADPGEVVRYERLVGDLAGVQFEISAYIGSQRIAVAA